MNEQAAKIDVVNKQRELVSGKKLKELQDLDLMPFGKYCPSRTPMQDVPAPYLHFLWINGIKNETKMNSPQGAVARYIERNINHLKKEYPDGIWK